jgi:hypothetical protein
MLSSISLAPAASIRDLENVDVVPAPYSTTPGASPLELPIRWYRALSMPPMPGEKEVRTRTSNAMLPVAQRYAPEPSEVRVWVG